MALTTMLEVMKKETGYNIGGSGRGRPISAERDRRDGDFDQTPSTDPDRYHHHADGGSGSGPGGGGGGERFDDDARASSYQQPHYSRSSPVTERARPRKRMRWDDQMELEADDDNGTSTRRDYNGATVIRSPEDRPDGTTVVAGGEGGQHGRYTGLEGRNEYDVPGKGPPGASAQHQHHQHHHHHKGQPPEQGPGNAAQQGMEDPVSLGLLPAEDVPYLFKCFHGKLNTYIALLDPDLHTPAYTLRTSPILFTAILTVTSQMYLPHLYKPLSKRVTYMLGLAFGRGDAEIGICQALSLLSVWKEPSDKGSWLRVGYAIRVAYELGLDAPPKRPLPADEFQAREILNGERTYRQLAAFDRTMQFLHGRAHRMISPEVLYGTSQWFRDHPEVYCYADVMLGASAMSGEFTDMLCRLDPNHAQMDDLTLRYSMHVLNLDFQNWKNIWFGPERECAVCVCVSFGLGSPSGSSSCFCYGRF